MNRFKKILYITDYTEEEEYALSQAVELTKANQASLTIASLLPNFPEFIPKEHIRQLQDDIESIEAHRQMFVHGKSLKSLAESDLELHHRTFQGVAFMEIIQAVMEDGYDLVVIPARSMHKNGYGFSSMSMHILRKCPCAVWAVRSTHPDGFKSIIAAVDPITVSEEQEELNRTLIRLAVSQGVRSDAAVHVVTAWTLEGEEWLRGPLMDMSEEEWSAVAKRAENAYQEGLTSLVNEREEPEVPVEQHLVRGHPSEVVCDYEEKLNCDLIVMGTLTRTGLEGFFMGHTAEEIIQKTRASVLALKPGSFKSPLAG
jgi:nucleotide-binding universal stress UspA family protein